MGQLLSKVALTLLLLCAPVHAQSPLWDWGGTTATYARHFTAVPSICFIGQIFILDGGSFYYCSSQNVWTVLNASYDLNAMFANNPASGLVGLRYVAPRAFRSPAHTNGDPAPAASGTPSTLQKDFVWAKNGTAFCSFRFAAGASTATYQSCALTNFVAGDLITLTAPSPADTGIANIGLTLPGVLN